jgi:hypothetical protein
LTANKVVAAANAQQRLSPNIEAVVQTAVMNNCTK